MNYIADPAEVMRICNSVDIGDLIIIRGNVNSQVIPGYYIVVNKELENVFSRIVVNNSCWSDGSNYFYASDTEFIKV
jgi:hypothetical protein